MTATRLLAAAGLVATALVSVGHAGEPRAIGWILSRTTNAATPVEGRLDVTGVSEESAVVMFATAGSGPHRHVDRRFVTTLAEWGVDGWAQVDDDSAPSVACAVACESPQGIPRTVYVTSNGRALTSTVYLAAFDVRDPVLKITSPGWTVRRWQPAWASLTTATADGSMVSAAHTSVGTYRGGRLAGGRYGSFVWAAMPCDNWGQGSATLTGGARSFPLSCSDATVVSDATPGRTTWSVTGEVTGVGWWTAVLIVVDYPHG